MKAVWKVAIAALSLMAAQVFASVPTGQLPDTVVPTYYKLHFNLYPEQARFSGATEIEVKVNKTTDIFYIHGQDLTIKSAKIVDKRGKTIKVKIDNTDVVGVMKVTAGKKLGKGSYNLVMTYDAPFNQDLEGIYRVKEGDKHFIFTQMQAISARLGFPSFDEPRFKTPFDMSITTDENLGVIGNTPDVKTTVKDGVKTVVFAKSKPMPTYLVALAVGDFDIVEWKPIPTTKVRDFEIPLRGVAVKGKGKELTYALQHTAEILDALEDYFQTPYPYRKLDIIAVPDFAAGAMENVGAITYREQLLLLGDGTEVSIGQKRAYTETHAHELAHQWFGNLVTPKWWNDIWLNEAFATWISQIALHRHFPEQQWRRELVRSAQGVMGSDSVPSARRIRNPIETNDDIVTAFDGITYQKGSSVLTMFEGFVGEENFRKGVQNYMQKYAWGTTDANDFINAIAEQSGENADMVVKAFFSFIEQVGLPQLDIETACNNNRTELTVKQQRYTPLGTVFKENTVWNVPACFSYTSDGVQRSECFMVDKPEQKITLAPQACVDSVMPNANASGYYRFNMNDKWDVLLGKLNELSPIEANSVIDSFKGAFGSGSISLEDFLKALPVTLKADSWEVQTSGLGYMGTLIAMAEESEKAKLREFASLLYKAEADKLGLEATTDLDKSAPVDAAKLRSRFVGFMAGSVKQPELRKTLAEMGAKYTGYKGDGELHPEGMNQSLLGLAMSIAVQEYGLDYAKFLMDSMLKSTDSTYRGRALGALSSTEDVKVAEFLLPYIMNTEIKDNEVIYLIFGLMGEEKLQSVSWPWVQKHVDDIAARLPQNYHAYTPYMFNGLCNQDGLDKLEKLIKPRLEQLTGANRNYSKAREFLGQCIARENHFKPQITKAFN